MLLHPSKLALVGKLVPNDRYVVQLGQMMVFSSSDVNAHNELHMEELGISQRWMSMSNIGGNVSGCPDFTNAHFLHLRRDAPTAGWGVEVFHPGAFSEVSSVTPSSTRDFEERLNQFLNVWHFCPLLPTQPAECFSEPTIERCER
jgi:hypothetical protein